MNRDSSVEISGVAIVGMAGRFPGASSVEEFWANLLGGRESIRCPLNCDCIRAMYRPVA
jgi:acyl transferase domain-containing protein